MCAAYSCYYGVGCCTIRSSIGSDNNPDFSSKSRSSSSSSSSNRQYFVEEMNVKASPQLHQHIRDIVVRQTQPSSSFLASRRLNELDNSPYDLEQAYQVCSRICQQSSNTSYLGSLLMTKERRRALWAVYAWGRRVDDLVDNNYLINCGAVLDEYQARLEDIFSGRPHDMVDAALVDAISNFPLDIEPFKDVLEGMRMDTYKNRYANFEELYLYCYYVAGTAALMSIPVLGIAQRTSLPAENIYNSALSFTIACQLTHTLRDVTEDADRGRVYLPQDELAEFGLSDDDILSRRMTDNWREFMKHQIKRARFYFQLAEEGASQVDKSSRWPAWSIMMKYKMILDEIEKNDYDTLTKPVDVGWTKLLLALPLAYLRAHHSAPSYL